MNSFIIFCVIVGFCSCAQLPATFKTCKQSEADYSTCLGAAIEDAVKQLKAPHPELGLPSLDPLVVSELSLNLHHKDIDLDEKIHKLSITGFSDIKVSHAAIDFNAKTIHFDVLIPKVTSNLDFEWAGTIEGEPTKIKATGRGLAQNGHLNVTATFEEYEQNGDKYIKIVDFYSHWSADDLKYSIESADKVEAEHVNNILKEHFAEILSETASDFDKVLGSIFLRLSNEVFSRVPVKFIFFD